VKRKGSKDEQIPEAKKELVKSNRDLNRKRKSVKSNQDLNKDLKRDLKRKRKSNRDLKSVKPNRDLNVQLTHQFFFSNTHQSVRLCILKENHQEDGSISWAP
jgi:hypothetical protein